MRERVSVCVVSCGGGRPANLFLSLFQKEMGRNKKRKMSGSFVAESCLVWSVSIATRPAVLLLFATAYPLCIIVGSVLYL